MLLNSYNGIVMTQMAWPIADQGQDVDFEARIDSTQFVLSWFDVHVSLAIDRFMNALIMLLLAIGNWVLPLSLRFLLIDGLYLIDL